MKFKVVFSVLIVTLAAFLVISSGREEQSSPPQVVINEVAWAGTQASGYDEWIELKNNTDQEIELTGWTISWKEDTDNPRVVKFPKPGKEEEAESIPAHGFYLLERSEDDTISDIEADFIYTGGLNNDGESLTLKNAEGKAIDTANADGEEWPAGTASDGDPAYASMERIDPMALDTEDNWASNNGKVRNGKDAEGKLINGTPRTRNSAVTSEQG